VPIGEDKGAGHLLMRQTLKAPAKQHAVAIGKTTEFSTVPSVATKQADGLSGIVKP